MIQGIEAEMREMYQGIMPNAPSQTKVMKEKMCLYPKNTVSLCTRASSCKSFVALMPF